MLSIKEELEEIEALDKQISKVNKKTTSIAAQAQEKLKFIQNRIRAGETTGDKLQDYLIARWGTLNFAKVDVYRDIDRRIGDHNGEFVLKIERSESFDGCSGMGYKPRDSEYHVHATVQLGVINGTGLIYEVEPTSCTIPTSKVVYTRDFRDFKMAESYYNKIASSVVADFGLHLNQPLLRRKNNFLPSDNSVLQLELMIGDREVKEWLKAQHSSVLINFQKAAKKLGRDITQDFPALIARDGLKREEVRISLLKLAADLRKTRMALANAKKTGTAVESFEEAEAKCIILLKESLIKAKNLGMENEQLLNINDLCKEFSDVVLID